MDWAAMELTTQQAEALLVRRWHQYLEETKAQGELHLYESMTPQEWVDDFTHWAMAELQILDELRAEQ